MGVFNSGIGGDTGGRSVLGGGWGRRRGVSERAESGHLRKLRWDSREAQSVEF